MRNEVKVLRDQIKDDMNIVMDERGVGGNEFHTNSILKAIEASVQKMQDIMSKAVVVTVMVVAETFTNVTVLTMVIVLLTFVV